MKSRLSLVIAITILMAASTSAIAQGGQVVKKTTTTKEVVKTRKTVVVEYVREPSAKRNRPNHMQWGAFLGGTATTTQTKTSRPHHQVERWVSDAVPRIGDLPKGF